VPALRAARLRPGRGPALRAARLQASASRPRRPARIRPRPPRPAGGSRARSRASARRRRTTPAPHARVVGAPSRAAIGDPAVSVGLARARRVAGWRKDRTTLTEGPLAPGPGDADTRDMSFAPATSQRASAARIRRNPRSRARDGQGSGQGVSDAIDARARDTRGMPVSTARVERAPAPTTPTGCAAPSSTSPPRRWAERTTWRTPRCVEARAPYVERAPRAAAAVASYAAPRVAMPCSIAASPAAP
jgi:hypothetical protein